MISNPSTKRAVKILFGAALAALLLVVCGPEPPESPPPASTGFKVHQVSLGVPNWLTPDKYNYKLHLSVVFTQDIDVSTLSMPGTVNMTYEVLGTNQKASDVAGVYFADPSGQDRKTIVFVSNQTASELGVSPGGGQTVKYSLVLIGTDSGSGAIKNTSGTALDGDGDGAPGGDKMWATEIVG